MHAIAHNSSRSRFEIYDDGCLAGFVRYRMQEGEIWLLSLQMLQDSGGKELAQELIRSTVIDLYRRRVPVLPFCPAVRRFISADRRYRSLVPAEQRSRFRLDAANGPSPAKAAARTTVRAAVGTAARATDRPELARRAG
jgi:uncharacterized protein